MKKFLSDYFPNVSKEWHPTKNGELKPSDVTYGSKKRVWWVCSEGHEWETVVSQRTNKKATGCPYCSGKKVNNENSFKGKYPELVKEWHPTKNGDLLPNNFTSGSKKEFGGYVPRDMNGKQQFTNDQKEVTAHIVWEESLQRKIAFMKNIQR